ncbi:PREDICTED: protein CASC5 [Condylura cristata]|uniref:protein CASC5 n=1 Tax=Condylura cristata TaxID=143302 RepID=UPI000334545F|nr:PREDICTED: protein CASC5 [Condylura cristata]
MDGMSSETNDEKENIEKPVRRRHSSILKPPRSPLQELRGGNETVQESNALRNKKNSRRVSFADTIKVFQTESNMKIVRKSETAEAEAGENVLIIQNKNPEDNLCEITGMNTLLCAPIQSQIQQREITVTEYNHEKKLANDQTVIFSDENQMDLTASHTVMITKGLLDCTQSETLPKIDTTSFLANLKLHTDDSRMKKESKFSLNQNSSSEKKINFNDFIRRMKTGNFNASSSAGPDKENSEISIHSKVSNQASPIHQKHASPNVDENSTNVTRIFREQDDGMNFTQCHTVNIQTLIPTSSEVSLREFKGSNTVIYGNDFMDLTANHTIQILPSEDNLSDLEYQAQNVLMDVTTGHETKVSGKKTILKNKPNATFQEPSLNPKGKIHNTKSHTTETEIHTITQTSNQDARTLTMIPESVYSSPAIQDYKTVFYSSCNDAMELTKCFSSMKGEKNLLKNDNNHSNIHPNPDATSLTEKTVYSEETNMDITKSHTVVIDNQFCKEGNTQIAATPICGQELMFQNCITMPEDKEMNTNYSLVPYVSKTRLQHNLANPLSVSLTDRNTEIFIDDDMDLTKSHTTNLRNQVSLVPYSLVPEHTRKFHSHSNRPSNECKEMTKSHIELLQQSNIIPANILNDKEKDHILQISPCLDKDSPQSVDINQNITKRHNPVYSDGDLDKQVPLGNNRNSVSCEQSSFSTTNPLFSSKEQIAIKNHNTAINSHTVESVPGQHSKLPEPLRKSSGNPTPDLPHDKTIICSDEEQNMDLTKSHSVVIGFGPSEVQLGKTNLKNTNSQLTTVNKQLAVKIEKCNKNPIEKNGVFISSNMDILEDKSVQEAGFLNEKQNVKICGRKSIGRLKIDKTILFSESDENDMDITKSYTVEINHKPLSDEYDSHLVSLAGTSKTVLYTCGQSEMEVTRSHTTAIECETTSPNKITSRPVDKTVMFADNHDELEMTKSHTIFIDYQAKEKTVLPDRPTFELSEKKSLEKPTMTATSVEESAFFPKNYESSHSAAKVSQLALPGGFIEKALGFIGDDNKAISKPTIWKNDRDVEKPRFLNEPLSGNSQKRNLKLKNDKIIAFSKNDKNIDIQSSAAEINNKNALEDEEKSHLVPLAEISKTVFCTLGQDDMEITRSHTTALEYKTVSPDKVTTRPVEENMLIGNHSELEITKSHTIFIDCQATEKLLQECPKHGTVKRKTLAVSFPTDDSSVQEITKKHTLAVENEIVHHTEPKLATPFGAANALAGDQSEIKVKLNSTAMEKEALGKDIVLAYPLEEKAKIKHCHLNSSNRRNMDFTNSHTTAICGSNDNTCLPNVISCDMTTVYDKNKKTSNCSAQNDLAYADDLVSEPYSKSEGLPFSDHCSLLDQIKVNQAETKVQLNSVLKDQDLIKEPSKLLVNQTLAYSQDLGEMTKFNSELVPCKFPKDEKKTCANDGYVSQPHLLTQLLPFPQQEQSIVNKDETILSKARNNLNIGNFSVPLCGSESQVFNNKNQFTAGCEKQLERSIQIANCNIAVDFHSNSDLPEQVTQTQTNLREANFTNIKPNLDNLNGKTEEFLVFQTVQLPPSLQLLELVNKGQNKNITQTAEIHNINIVSSSVKDDRNEEKNSPNGAVPLTTAIKDKVRRCSLGIFLPRLPNKRNCSVSGIDDLEQIPAYTTNVNHLETQPASNKNSSSGFVAAKLNLSPSQYINEENPPMYPGEINSSDSTGIEAEEKTLTETYQKESAPSKNKMEETANSQKRTWVQDDDDVQHEKKIRKSEIKFSDTPDQEIFDYRTEGDIDKIGNSVLIKNLSRTPSSCSSSLDSVKAEGTSLDFSAYHNSQMESQFLRDTICEESLKEKLRDGKITIREFFILLQVHILIQKPRQSNLPAKFPINTPPTLEDLMLSQYVYRPKIQIYREDCDVLRQKIEELKLSASNQDKLLTEANKNLWEKMRLCSDEELKDFGIYLNKIKSRFTKMTKVFTHQGKVALYSKLVQSAQNEKKKLQIWIDGIDNILTKIDNCLTEVEIETKNLEEKDNPMEEWDSEIRAAEKELEQLKTEEEKLQRDLVELEVQKEQILNQIDLIQKQRNAAEEHLDQLSLSEWDIIEWSDEQAIFTFLYDTLELTVTFGEPVVGLPFLDKPYRKIIDLNFQSLLDEDKAPSSSLLVHKLIFQYIEKQEFWKKTCTTQHQIPKMLQEISQVVSHCRLLGEEIEFLKRWGPNYNLMNINVNNTELKLLFSSSAAFAKFEITFSLSVNYPSTPLPFSIQNHLGNIGQDKIAVILSKVPLEDNYLKNVVKQIYQDLLQGYHFCH